MLDALPSILPFFVRRLNARALQVLAYTQRYEFSYVDLPGVHIADEGELMGANGCVEHGYLVRVQL